MHRGRQTQRSNAPPRAPCLADDRRLAGDRLDGIRRFGLDLVEDLEPDPLGVTDPRLLPPRHAMEIEKKPNPRPLLEKLPTLEQAVTAMREAARAQTMPGVTFVDKQKGAFPAQVSRLTVWNPV